MLLGNNEKTPTNREIIKEINKKFLGKPKRFFMFFMFWQGKLTINNWTNVLIVTQTYPTCQSYRFIGWLMSLANLPTINGERVLSVVEGRSPERTK